jgi:hypothetical protein
VRHTGQPDPELGPLVEALSEEADALAVDLEAARAVLA